MENRRIHCLGIATSPRVNGNTTILLQKALAGAAAAGAKTELVSLNQYKFSPCIACNGCYKEGKCVIRDDMQQIYDKLLSADRIILAAPVFSMGICAQAKAMIDRTQRFWATRYILNKSVIADQDSRPPRKGIFISAAGSGHRRVFDGAVQVAKYFFLMLEAEFAGSFCYRQIDEKGAILNHPGALKEVYEAGFNLAGS